MNVWLPCARAGWPSEANGMETRFSEGSRSRYQWVGSRYIYLTGPGTFHKHNPTVKETPPEVTDPATCSVDVRNRLTRRVKIRGVRDYPCAGLGLPAESMCQAGLMGEGSPHSLSRSRPFLDESGEDP